MKRQALSISALLVCIVALTYACNERQYGGGSVGGCWLSAFAHFGPNSTNPCAYDNSTITYLGVQYTGQNYCQPPQFQGDVGSCVYQYQAAPGATYWPFVGGSACPKLNLYCNGGGCGDATDAPYCKRIVDQSGQHYVCQPTA